MSGFDHCPYYPTRMKRVNSHQKSGPISSHYADDWPAMLPNGEISGKLLPYWSPYYRYDFGNNKVSV